MNRLAGSAVCVHLLLAGLVTTACRQPPPEQQFRDITVYRPIGTWTGRGPQQTEAFIGQTGAFRVRWHTENTPGTSNGTFRLFLHSSVSGRLLLTVAERQGAGGGEAHVVEDPREFFLVIDASGLEWSVTLDEAVSARAPVDGSDGTL
ncbi:MAG: hypothetical protein AB7F99_10410 [Vicinamibacterales bacterium]